jgi:hypothetical protein
METTFNGAGAHLGVETQRKWNDKAMARTTPALLTLYSLVILIAAHLIGTKAMRFVRQRGIAKCTPPFPTPLPWCTDVCGVMDIFHRLGPKMMS